MAKTIERRDQCCLCGKLKEQVPKLIVGLHGAVCSDCVDLCNDILTNGGEKPASQGAAPIMPRGAVPPPVKIGKTLKPKEIVSF